MMPPSCSDLSCCFARAVLLKALLLLMALQARPSIGEMREALKALFDDSWWDKLLGDHLTLCRFEATWERGRSDLETSLRAFYQVSTGMFFPSFI